MCVCVRVCVEEGEWIRVTTGVCLIIEIIINIILPIVAADINGQFKTRFHLFQSIFFGYQ